MTNPKYETIYCEVCGTPVGSKPGQGAVLGVTCLDPICRFVEVAGIEDARNAMIVAMMEKSSVPTIAAAFNMTRQRVYQIYHDWVHGL